MMRTLIVAAIMIFGIANANAEPSQQLVLQVHQAVVQVHVEDKRGEHGLGSGVVVARDYIATNCHVLANARGVLASQGEDNYFPVALKADWRHDLCLLKFERLPLKPIALGDTSQLRYEQSVFSIGHSNGSVTPLISFGKVKALYPLDDSRVIRTSTAFRMGASGSALFSDDGVLVGINTFKSPGRNGYYYALPVEWIKHLMDGPEVALTATTEPPFWDVPEAQRPYFMRVVPPLQAEHWGELGQLATAWTQQEPTNAEAWYNLGLAEEHQGLSAEAEAHYRKAMGINPQHAGALYELGLMASRQGNQAEMHRVVAALAGLDDDMAEELKQAAGCSAQC
jgi:tetratricopeptide (TPR) repeat protein